MKKLLWILVMLLWWNVGFAEEKKEFVFDDSKIAWVNTYLNLKGYKLHSIDIASDDSAVYYHLIKKDDFITCIYFHSKEKSVCLRP